MHTFGTCGYPGDVLSAALKEAHKMRLITFYVCAENDQKSVCQFYRQANIVVQKVYVIDGRDRLATQTSYRDIADAYLFEQGTEQLHEFLSSNPYYSGNLVVHPALPRPCGPSLPCAIGTGLGGGYK